MLPCHVNKGHASPVYQAPPRCPPLPASSPPLSRLLHIYCFPFTAYLHTCCCRVALLQTVFPVAVLQRLVGIYLDAHIYAYISYGGAMVPALVRAALQNAASLLLLLSMDVRARWVFERTAVRRKALGCSPSSSKSALGALQ